jgi:rubredoxin-NAD+ reductase
MHQSSSTNKPIVVIGSGLAAYTVIREFRKLNTEQSIILITRDAGDFYSKPMLSTAFASKKEAAQLITTAKEKMEAQLGIRILSRTQVTKIDDELNTIVSLNDAGELATLEYAQLILAMGADPIVLKSEGDGAAEVLSVNDLDDYAKFREKLTDKKHIAILGAGLIGCEFANDLLIGGYQVDVIDPSSQVLGRLLPEAVASELQNKLSELGVRWHLNTTASSIVKQDGKLILNLADGTQVSADLVLSAVGLRPRIAIAQEAGIAVGRGIVVNRQLQTSVNNIYALGDCAEIGGLVLPYVMPIMHAAKTLAAVLAGQTVELIYPAMPVVVKTPALPLVVSPPAINSQGLWNVTNIEGGMLARFENDAAELLGFVLAGQATNQRAALTKCLPDILPAG